MAKLTASMVVDLQDRTGRKVQTIIGNLDRLKRAERNADLANQGFRLTAREIAQERLMIEQARAAQERQARYQTWINRGMIGVTLGAAATTAAVRNFASLERQMTRIGITADATAAQTEAAMKTLRNQTSALSMPLEQGISALDTLVASGQSLEEALAFLPSVLATAQATGAATEDIANTGLKAASALKIPAAELQRAFDVMVMGGKAGQFEMRDMAQYIPGLANSFATLGYEGEEGLKKLIAVLQTLREDTGDASSAATQAGEIFGKIYSDETANKFKKFGVDIRAELDAAKASGEDVLSAFVRLSKEAINGDLSKLPQLFTDKDFRLGMQSLLTSPEALKKFFDVMNSSNVDGTVLRDLGVVLSDTQSSIDKLSNSWDRLINSFGKAVAPGATAVMDAVSGDIEYGDAVRQALEKRGMSYWERESWMLKNLPFGGLSADHETDRVAYEGGLRDPEFLKRYFVGMYESEGTKASTGRQNVPVVHKGLGAGPETKQAPVPLPRPDPLSVSAPSKVEQVLDKPVAPKPVEPGNALDGLTDHQRRRELLRNADPAALGMQGMGGVIIEESRSKAVSIEGTPTVTLSGTPQVTITNPPPRPNVVFNMTINEASDAEKLANYISSRVRSEIDGLQASTNDSGL